ncbi:MAG: hypothetical protein WA863_05680 [Methyloceanibacter sp.]
MAVREVLAVTLLLSGAQTASADDLKDCTSAPPDQAIVACTNLIEGGKFDSQEQAIAYTNRGGVWPSARRAVSNERLPISIVPSSSTPGRRRSTPIVTLFINR